MTPAPMNPHLLKAVGMSALLATIGCESATRPTPRVHAVTLTTATKLLPAPAAFPAGNIFELRVQADPGVDTTVRWSTSDSVAGKVDAGGVLRLCESIPTLFVTATSVADPTKSATARATVASLVIGWAGINAVLQAGTNAPADPAALRGDVIVRIGVDERFLGCTGLSRLQVVAEPSTGGAEVQLANLLFTPPRRTALVEDVTWSTTRVPNDEYVLSVRAYLAGRTEPAASNERPGMVVRN